MIFVQLFYDSLLFLYSYWSKSILREKRIERIRTYREYFVKKKTYRKYKRENIIKF